MTVTNLPSRPIPTQAQYGTFTPQGRLVDGPNALDRLGALVRLGLDVWETDPASHRRRRVGRLTRRVLVTWAAECALRGRQQAAGIGTPYAQGNAAAALRSARGAAGATGRVECADLASAAAWAAADLGQETVSQAERRWQGGRLLVLLMTTPQRVQCDLRRVVAFGPRDHSHPRRRWPRSPRSGVVLPFRRRGLPTGQPA